MSTQKDWQILKCLYNSEDGCYEDECSSEKCSEREILEYIGTDDVIRADWTAFQLFREDDELRKHIADYPVNSLQKLMMTFICFDQFSKALLVGKEGLKHHPNDPQLLTYCLRAASYSDRGGAGKHFFVKLIYDVPREKLPNDGYQEAVHFLLPTAKMDEALCRELLKDYRHFYPLDQEYWLLLCELELALKNNADAMATLKCAMAERKDAFDLAKKLFQLQRIYGDLTGAEETAWYGMHAIIVAENSPSKKDVAFFVMAIIEIEAEKIFAAIQRGDSVPEDRINSLMERLLRYERDYSAEEEFLRRSVNLRLQLAALSSEDFGRQYYAQGINHSQDNEDKTGFFWLDKASKSEIPQ